MNYVHRHAIAVILLPFALLACGQSDRGFDSQMEDVEGPEAAPSVPREVHRTLDLDRVLAGQEDGEGLTFGRVRHVAVEASGGVVVEDAMTRAVVRLEPDGEFRDSLGRVGQGPGEYRYPFGVAALPDGSVAIRDNEPPAIVIFDARGEFVREWTLYDRVKNSEGLNIEISADPDGRLRLLVPFERSPDMYALPDYGFVTLTPTGEIVDSVSPPSTPWDGPQLWGEYHARKHVAWHPDGFPVVGMSNAYHLELQRPEGVIQIDRPYEPVPVSDGEKEQDRVVRLWERARGAMGVDERPTPPDYKAAYSRILVARTGEIWVFLHGVGEQWATQDMGNDMSFPLFREPVRVDVFDAQGMYLWTVDGDSSIDPKVISGDTVWAVVTGEHDEHSVARYLVR